MSTETATLVTYSAPTYTVAAPNCDPVPPSVAPGAPNTRFYVPVLDGLRAVAFLFVFVAHSGLDKIVPGGFGVTIFFFLSGYLITTLMRIEATETGGVSLRNFYLRRCRRILPPLYLTLALAYVLAHLGWLGNHANGAGALSVLLYFANYSDLLGVKSALPAGMGVVWSLMIEEHFYFIFPIVYKLFCRNGVSRMKQAKILAALCSAALMWRIVLIFIIHVRFPVGGYPRTYTASDARYDAILWGCILAIAWNPWFHDRAKYLDEHKGKLSLAGIATLFLSLIIRNPQFRETLRYSLQSIALIPIFYFCISVNSPWTRCLHWKPVRKLGQVSYSMYLIHLVLLTLIGRVFHLSYLVVAPIAFVISLSYASIMKFSVEDPFRKLI